MPVISVSIPENLLKRVNRSIKEQGFANRSEIIRQALRSFITEYKGLRELEGEITATITIIYGREAKRGQISDIQHNYGNIISTFLHAHVDEDHCVEVIVVKGEADTVKELIEALRANEQIIQNKVVILRD